MRILLYIVLLISQCFALEKHILSSIDINRNDIAAKQRGAQVFFNYCSGCHSLQYVRYSDMARDLKIFNKQGMVDKDIILNYLNFVNDDYRSQAVNAMSTEDALSWFGKRPPDLSLETRVRGNNWIYTFLKSYYVDPKRPTGVNNLLFKDVAMPNPFSALQGLQYPIIDEHGNVVGLKKDPTKTVAELESYDRTLKDLVAFLDYVAEPHKQQRLQLGRYVMLFLVVFSLTAYLYYREVWKDVE